MKVVLYGADWCPDCTRSKRFLEENNIEYGYMDLQKDPSLADKVVEINTKLGKGPNRSIPTIVIDDTKVLVEPSNEELGNVLGVNN
jgi:glutaredoxin